MFWYYFNSEWIKTVTVISLNHALHCTVHYFERRVSRLDVSPSADSLLVTPPQCRHKIKIKCSVDSFWWRHCCKGRHFLCAVLFCFLRPRMLHVQILSKARRVAERVPVWIWNPDHIQWEYDYNWSSRKHASLKQPWGRRISTDLMHSSTFHLVKKTLPVVTFFGFYQSNNWALHLLHLAFSRVLQLSPIENGLRHLSLSLTYYLLCTRL